MNDSSEFEGPASELTSKSSLRTERELESLCHQLNDVESLLEEALADEQSTAAHLAATRARSTNVDPHTAAPEPQPAAGSQAAGYVPQHPKLVIQIPCYNEEQTLGVTLSELPRSLEGIGSVQWLIVDDGSQDNTVQIAEEHGVDYIVKLPRNQGLARAFTAGLDAALASGADIIVNTDADNQYSSADIETLIDPILQGRAEFVIGARPICDTPHFSRLKKTLQRFGSWVVRRFSKTNIPDAPSGFRAMTREVAMRLKVFSDYTYTLETIIQAGQKDMAITSVPIRTNPDLRPSRLLKSIPNYVIQSALTIIRIFATYRPFQFFAVPSLILGSVGLLICCRFLFFYFTDGGGGHVQSLILGSLLIGLGFAGLIIGLVADLISVNRKLLEQVDWRIQQLNDALQRLKR